MGVLYEAWADVVYREDKQSKVKVRKDVVAFAKEISKSFFIVPEVDGKKFKNQVKKIAEETKSDPIVITATLEKVQLDNELKKLRIREKERKLSIPVNTDKQELDNELKRLRIEQSKKKLSIPVDVERTQLDNQLKRLRIEKMQKKVVPVSVDDSGIKNIRKGADDASKAVSALNGSIISTVAAVGILKQGFDIGKSAVLEFANLEASLGGLQVILDASNKDMQRLKQTAIDLGNDMSLPGVSALDASEAMIALSRNGLQLNDVLKSSKSVLQLAKISNLDYADSARIVAANLNAFQLPAQDAVRVVDLLANASRLSGAKLPELSDGLAQVGAVAKQFGFSIDETVAALTALNKAGIQGSDAGTSIKAFLTALASPSKEAKTALKELGFSIKDAQGNIKPMGQLVDELSKSLGKMGEAQKTATLATIFGTDGMRAAGVLADVGGKKFQTYTDGLAKSGIAAKTLAAQNRGLKGAMDALSSRLSTMALQLGEAIAPIVKKVVDGISWFIDEIKKGNPVIIGFATAIGSLSVLAVIVPIVNGLTAAMTALGASFLTNPITLVVVGIVALGAALFAAYQKFEGFRNIVDSAWQSIQKIWDAIVKNVTPAINSLKDAIQPVIDAFKNVGTEIGNVFKIFKDTFSKEGFNMDSVQKALSNIDWKSLGVSYAKLVGKAIKFAVVDVPIIELKFAWRLAKNYGADYAKLILKGIKGVVFDIPKLELKAAFEFAKDAGKWVGDLLSKGYDWAVEHAKDIGEWIAKIFAIGVGAVIFPVPMIIALMVKLGQKIIEVIPTVAGMIGSAISSVFSTAFNFAKDTLLPGIGNFIADIFTGMWNLITTNAPKIWHAIGDIFTGALTFLGGFLEGFGSTIWGFLSTGFNFITENVGGFISGIINFFIALPGRIITAIGNIGSSIWNFLSGAFTTVKNNIGEWVSGVVRFFYNLPGRIVDVLSSLGEKIGKVFKKAMNFIVSPVNLIIKGVNGIIGLLPGKQPKIPLIEFHTGGVVGETKAKPHAGGGRLSRDEMLAVVQRGETILPTDVSKNLSRKEANMLVDGRFDDFAHSISGKKGINQKEAQSIDYRLLAENLKGLRGEYGFGFGDVWNGIKNIGSKAVDLARQVGGEVLAKTFDVAIAPLKALLSPLGFPGDAALGLATKMRDVAVDFVKGVKDVAEKEGIFKASGEYSLFNSNQIAAEAAKNITPALLNKVVAAQGKSGSWKVLREYIQATKIPHVITSTVRPGAITQSGNVSNHSLGRAIDVAGLTPSIDSKALGDIFWAFMPIGKLLNELIYAGPQVAKNIKRGLLVPKYAQSIHHNHVHAALHTGGMVGRDGFASRGFNPRSEMMMKLEKGEYVINRDAVNKIGVDNLDRLNNGETINYNSSGGGDTINVYGVSPEQVLAEIEVRKQLKKSRMVI